MSKKEVVGF
uniref:Uncharacterized protein n=1 Tax=Rhizophora mucronata TaxID=61149 RepID=A0A2P2Q3G1_RHIMU